MNPFQLGDRVRYKREFDPTGARTKGSVIETLTTVAKVRWDVEMRNYSGETLAVHWIRLEPLDAVERLAELA